MEMGNIYGEIESNTYVLGKSIVPISVLVILFLVLCYLGVKWYKQIPQDKLLVVGYFFGITGILVLGVVNSLQTYEGIYTEKYYNSPYYEDFEDITIYAELETSKINAVKVDDTYYYISGDNWSIMDSNYFENKMIELQET